MSVDALSPEEVIGMPWQARWPRGPRVLSFAAVLQAVILTVTLLAPAAISAEEPPVDPPSAPPASEPADPPADPPPADPPAEPPPVEPAEEPAPPPSIMCAATGSELVTTDKFDYAPEETVVITGTGFAADCDVVVRVTRPDGSIVTGDGTFVWGSDTVSTDALGGLVYDYILDGIEGEYLVDMLGADDTVLATTLFADAIPAGTPTIWGDAAATVKQQAFERGDSIYVRLPGAFTAPDITDKYRLQPIQLVSGTTYVFGPMSACLTPNANGIVGAQVAGQEAFSVISANRWKERLYIYPNSGCTGSPTTRDGAETYHVFEAFAFTSSVARDACASDATCGPASPRPIVAPGSTVYLKIGISQASRNFAGFQFIRPDGSAACTIGPLTSDANGAVSIDYPSGICPAIAAAASDIGAWTIKATAVGAAAGGVFAFADSKFNTNIGAF
ncbi:MAG TPA: hypothetical protein VFX65_05455, partial [Candidatus Limnocylindrales bacterium]|nr:hypothetical protein [Candidatus Limnocylindrales bacterium]